MVTPRLLHVPTIMPFKKMQRVDDASHTANSTAALGSRVLRSARKNGALDRVRCVVHNFQLNVHLH